MCNASGYVTIKTAINTFIFSNFGSNKYKESYDKKYFEQIIKDIIKDIIWYFSNNHSSSFIVLDWLSILHSD